MLNIFKKQFMLHPCLVYFSERTQDPIVILPALLGISHMDGNLKHLNDTRKQVAVHFLWKWEIVIIFFLIGQYFACFKFSSSY